MVSSSRGGDVEVLVLARGRSHRGDDPVGDVVDVGEGAGLLATAEDLAAAAGRASTLAIRSGTAWAIPGSSRIGQLARSVGVERAADREPQAMLIVGGARVDLAGELGEAVGRARRRTGVDVRLGGGEFGRPLEHHRGGDIGKALDVLLDRGVDDRARERVVDFGQGERELVEVGDTADDRRQMDHVRAAAQAPRARREVAQVTQVELAALAHPLRRLAMVGDPNLPVGVAQQAADDRRADRAGAAGDEHPSHQCAASARRRAAPASNAAASAA